jgi:hypothetical protein
MPVLDQPGVAVPARATTDAVPRRRRVAARLTVAAALAWTAFVAANALLTGSWWAWALVGMVPPLAFLVVPLALAGALAALRSRCLVAWIGMALSLLAGLGQSGVVWPQLHAAAPSSGAIRVVTWNTEYWDQGEPSGALYRYLARRRADVYVLQEYGFWNGREIRPIDRVQRLQAWFPGYRVVNTGEVLTLSRFPVSRRPQGSL